MARDFVWDPRKAAKNLVDHGVAFDAAVEVFSDQDHLILDTTRMKDGERRSKASGLIQGRLFIVVFTIRDGATRIISARRANRQEERAYGSRSPQS